MTIIKLKPIIFIDEKDIEINDLSIEEIDAAMHRIRYNGGKCGRTDCGCYEEPLKILARKKLKDQSK